MSSINGDTDNLFKKNFLLEHGIREHLIVMSLDEMVRNNTWAKLTVGLGMNDNSVVMINQLMYTFYRESIYVIENKTREGWYWGPHTFQRLHPTLKYDYEGKTGLMYWEQFKLRLGNILWFILTFACMSTINAVFIRISIKCSVLLIFPMIVCQNRFGQNQIGYVQRRIIYQSMGNIGALSAYFDRNRRNKCLIYFAVVTILMVYYLMYLASYSLWTFMAFQGPYSGSLNDSYFFYMNSVELLSFIFIRTRSSIKYLPKYLTIANLIFLMYTNSYMYPCQFEALGVLQNFSYFLFLYFLKNFEYEALENWSPFGFYTPSEHNPRTGYHHVFLGSEYQYGFDIFSMGFPLRFREAFSTPNRSAF